MEPVVVVNGEAQSPPLEIPALVPADGQGEAQDSSEGPAAMDVDQPTTSINTGSID
jgi:hypothetical protein